MDEAAAVVLLEDGGKLYVPVDLLPRGAEEGQWLIVVLADGKFKSAVLDLEKTEMIRERIGRKRALLLERMRRRQDSED